MTALATPRLAALAGRVPPLRAPVERCDLCAEPIPPGHRHLIDVTDGGLMCACGACAVLFDHQAAGGRHYRLVPRRRVELAGRWLDGPLWAALGVPVDLAFFVTSGATGEVLARYPSAAGTLRATVPADGWRRLVAARPELDAMAPDVEAFVVDRAKGAAEHWILPLDDCYRLTALLREHWTGFSGGPQVWARLGDFFDCLRKEPKG